VVVDGVNQYGPGALYAYQETSSTVVTFTAGLHVGAEVKFSNTVTNASSYGTATQINYTPPFTGGAATNVSAKLAQTPSVKDFGAIGNGVADDTDAFTAAWAAANPQAVYVPAASYLITGTVTGKFYSFGVVTVVSGTVTSITNLVP
jgi:polygalacturonase